MKMRNDSVKLKLQSDSLILSYANSHVCRLRAAKGEKYNHVSHRLTNFRRLLLERESIENTSLCMLDLIDPTKFDLVVKAIQNLSAGDKKSKSLGLR